MVRLTVFVAVMASAAGGAGGREREVSWARDAAPVELEEAVRRAERAIGELQQRLAQRLMEELGERGAVAAIAACRDEAPAMAAAAGQAGVVLGRTSHKLRNPKNAARPWLRRFVAEAAGKKAAAVTPRVVDLGGKIGVLRPIPTQGLCLSCHGDRASFSPELRKALRNAYPSDRAVGFAEGDLRGWFWAEVERAPRK